MMGGTLCNTSQTKYMICRRVLLEKLRGVGSRSCQLKITAKASWYVLCKQTVLLQAQYDVTLLS